MLLRFQGIDYYAREGDELKIKDIPTFSLY